MLQGVVMPTGLGWHDSSPKTREQEAIVVHQTGMLTRDRLLMRKKRVGRLLIYLLMVCQRASSPTG